MIAAKKRAFNPKSRRDITTSQWNVRRTRCGLSSQDHRNHSPCGAPRLRLRVEEDCARVRERNGRLSGARKETRSASLSVVRSLVRKRSVSALACIRELRFRSGRLVNTCRSIVTNTASGECISDFASHPFRGFRLSDDGGREPGAELRAA